MSLNLPLFIAKNAVRKVLIEDIEIGADSSLSFMRENSNKTQPIFALEIPMFVGEDYPLKDYWNEHDLTFENLVELASHTYADILCVAVNIDEAAFEGKKNDIVSKLLWLETYSDKPLLIKGTGNKSIDKFILPEIADKLTRKSIIAYGEESTYEHIVPNIVKNDHILILRTPIDINLAKELNILSIDMGLSPDRILIDPDMGALGYGFDYGYSIIEKIKQAAFDSDFKLNMPIITFVGEETYKTKEAKSDKFTNEMGFREQRAIMWEISAASSVISAGSNIVVLFHPEAIRVLKELLWD